MKRRKTLLTSWIIPYNAIRHDNFFTIRVPSFGPEPGFGSSWTRRHVEKGNEADDKCDERFDKEQPAPSSMASHTIELKETNSKEASKNIDGVVASVEINQVDRWLCSSEALEVT
jgi:hypothetical protein